MTNTKPQQAQDRSKHEATAVSAVIVTLLACYLARKASPLVNLSIFTFVTAIKWALTQICVPS